MILKTFRIQNFRSISDSGVINVDEVTTLVGRNESGKSNLLLALAALNPPDGLRNLSRIKDFPRDRRLEECTDNTQVVTTTWELEEAEKQKLVEIAPGSANATEVTIGRYYAGVRWVQFANQFPTIDSKEMKALLRRLAPEVSVFLQSLSEAQTTDLSKIWNVIKESMDATSQPREWASIMQKAATLFREEAVRSGATIPDNVDEHLATAEQKADEILDYEEKHTLAINTIDSWVPKFIYIAEFPELHGHQNLSEHFTRKGQNQLTDADKNFEKLAKVAGFDPTQLQNLMQQGDHETRNQLVNRAGAVVTREIRRLWKDRDLKIRFNLDAQYFDTFVSDPNTTYDVEVNLDERSRGFKWFFSFYISFAADTSGGNADGAILLLDEPGLYLHAASQGDLLKHLRADFNNQILYTTHSPFMVPADAIGIVRTVNISQEKGTQVTNDPSGDRRTLFPLQAALGYHLSQTLFIGNANLVIEGVTDFWILSSVSSHFRAAGKKAFPDNLVLTPAGGAPRVPYMVTLLTAERLDVLVLLDDEREGRDTRTNLITSKLIRDDNILFVTEAFSKGVRQEADIEDLIDPTVYEALVKECYQTELNGVTLSLNANIPRIVKRFEDGFRRAGLDFQKTRPARLFMTKMGSAPESVLNDESLERFQKLFQIVTQRLKKHKDVSRQPFE